MGYRALLFCPDEKTARTVTLVLNDLEFAVEVCSEPFAAVKKLMGEHFDGVVVDCDNEQNATLLFKSARQSTSNQAALAVAVVEGQAGVAKAFRIGANLVLTKPINVEQAKGTLRVARGLLRKSEPARALAQAETASAAAANASAPARSLKTSAPSPSSHVSPPVPAPSRQAATPPVKANPWGNRITEPPVPVASSPAQYQELAELDEEEISIEAESPSPAASTTPPARAAAPAKTAFSAMKQMAPKASDSSSPGALSAGAAAFGTSQASAAAPARIPQAAKTAEPLLSKIARTVGSIDESAEHHEIEPAAVARNPVSDTAFGADESETIVEPILPPATQSKSPLKSPSKSSSPGNTKILLGVLVVLLLIAALYLVWTQVHGQIKLGSTISNLLTPATEAKSQPALPPAQPTSPPSAATAIAKPVLQSVQDAKQTGSSLVNSNSGPDTNEGTTDTDNDVSATGPVKGSSGPAKTSARPLLVKSGKENASKRAAADAAAPSVVLSVDNSPGPLPSLIDVSTKSTPVLQTLSLSQGVAQGLIVKKVQPNYPSAALRLHLEGQVQLMATVTKSGNIAAVKTVSGEPMLAQAANEAVKQWKYKPYLLNGEPVEIQTQVTINFKLPR